MRSLYGFKVRKTSVHWICCRFTCFKAATGCKIWRNETILIREKHIWKVRDKDAVDHCNCPCRIMALRSCHLLYAGRVYSHSSCSGYHCGADKGDQREKGAGQITKRAYSALLFNDQLFRYDSKNWSKSRFAGNISVYGKVKNRFQITRSLRFMTKP